MQLKVLIIDDEAPARRRMASLLKQEVDCELLGQAESGTEAIQLIRDLQPNLLLLDIQLKDKTGFEVMQAVGSDFTGALIFITAFDEYAIQAFEVSAIDYLLKPYKAQRFKQAIARARHLLTNQQQPSVADLLQHLQLFPRSTSSSLKIPEGKTIHYLDTERLEYIQADGAYSQFHSLGSTKIIRIGLKQVAELLPEQFVRINRSVIINRGKISWTRALANSTEIEMESGIQFVTSRAYPGSSLG